MKKFVSNSIGPQKEGVVSVRNISGVSGMEKVIPSGVRPIREEFWSTDFDIFKKMLDRIVSSMIDLCSFGKEHSHFIIFIISYKDNVPNFYFFDIFYFLYPIYIPQVFSF